MSFSLIANTITTTKNSNNKELKMVTAQGKRITVTITEDSKSLNKSHGINAKVKALLR